MRFSPKIIGLLLFMALGFGLSAYVAFLKLSEPKQLIIEDFVVAPSEEKTLRWKENPEASPTDGGFKPNQPCVPLPQYTEFRRRMGGLVNTRSEYRRNDSRFAKAVDDFRLRNGIPISVRVKSERLEKFGVVYANCVQTCKGEVNEVFVLRVVGDKWLEVLGLDGNPKKIELTKADVEIAIMDEVNGEGVPFRSWKLPFADGPFHLMGKDIFWPLDIRGLALKVSHKGDWKIVAMPKEAEKLETLADRSLVTWCLDGEQCFSAKEPGLRYFKKPIACQN